MIGTLLQVRGEYSLLAGVGDPASWAARAKALGYAAVGLADVNRMSGLILFWQECTRQGLRPLLGAELREAAHPERAVTLFARNDEGYGDLCELVTRRQMNGPGFSVVEELSKPWPNLVLLASHTGVLQALSHGANRERLHGALVRHSPEARAKGRELEIFCDRENIPVAACADAWFQSPSEHELHRVLRAIDLNSTLSRLREGETAPSGAWLRPRAGREGLTDLFASRPDALENADRIGRDCGGARPPMNGWVMPEIKTPDGSPPAQWLAQLAREGLRRNYAGKPEFARAAEIQEMELGVIGKLGYASYFLMVKEVYDEAGRLFSHEYRRPKDCSLLRGSAANSLTFYNLGVGRLDPIGHNLYFQRFLNEDRASPPDADLDFGWDEREHVLDHVVRRFGREHVAITSTFQHFRFRAAFREAAKVFGYAGEQVTEVLEARQSRERRRDDDEIRMLERWAARLKGRPRFFGQHPGGLIITNKPIWRHVACEWSGGAKNRLITQIDMHSGIDELGLIKFDLLGNGSLSVLRDALAQIRGQGLPDPGVWDLQKCFDDPAAGALMRSGKTLGVFYLESPAQTRLNKKADVETFDEVIVTSSLIRPAGTAYAKTYVDRHRKHKRGIKDWDFLHPSLEGILGDTHDVCAFQEDVTRICHEVAGMSYKRADAVRKQMNSQHDGALSSPELRLLAEEFVTGCMSRSGLGRAQADELWRRVASFTGFSFCKSHSASYAQLSYQCVWLKAHHPAEFLSAVISNNHGFYRREIYLNEVRRLGLRLRPADVNHSGIAYAGRGSDVRAGFIHLKRVSEETKKALCRERDASGPYRHLGDFLRRVPAGRMEVESLVLAGAFDGFGMTQPELLFELDGIYRRDSLRAHGHGAAQPSLLEGGDIPRLQGRQIRDYTLMQRCLNEQRLFGYMLSGNPLDVIDMHPASRDAVPASELHRHVGRRVKVFGLYVAARFHTVLKTGRSMKFLTLEDRSGPVDVIFWPDVLDQWEEQLLEGGPFEVWGKVSEDWDTFSLEAERVRPAAFLPGLVDFEKASARLRAGIQAHGHADAVVPVIRAA